MSLTAERSTNKSIPFLSTDNYSHIPRQYLNFTIENLLMTVQTYMLYRTNIV